MSIKVGVPRALLYYQYSPLWINFFNNLGAEVIISDKTNKNILNQGTINTVDDACIPVKLFNGHVINLLGKVDYLFIPRLISIDKDDYICPKFCGLNEVVKNSVSKLPKVIDTKVDLKNIEKIEDIVVEIGKYICNDKEKILQAYQKAYFEYKKTIEKYKYGLIPYYDYNKNVKERVMIIGHPYVLYDDYLNMNIINKLKKIGYDIITPEMIDKEIIKQYVKNYDGKIFWSFSRKFIGACLYLIENKNVNGVLYLSSFACGIDSIVAEIFFRKIKNNTTIPFMLLTIDEHTGEAGFNTRLEAFVDMLRWRVR